MGSLAEAQSKLVLKVRAGVAAFAQRHVEAQAPTARREVKSGVTMFISTPSSGRTGSIAV
ncbi:hypothetical protein EMIT0P218_100120 [Pseudomonas sp. IT-P218]